MLLGNKNTSGKAHPDFNQLCTDISKIKHFTRSGTGKGRREKEVQQTNANSSMRGRFTAICRICGIKFCLSLKECQRQNRSNNGAGTATSLSSAGGMTKGGSANTNKTCNYCGLKGHMENKCYSKNLKKAQRW